MCALRGFNRPDTRVSGRFSVAALRTGALRPCAASGGYPCTHSVGTKNPRLGELFSENSSAQTPDFLLLMLGGTLHPSSLPPAACLSDRRLFLSSREVDTISKTTEQLKAEKTENEQEIDRTRHRNQRLENRIRYLTEGERKKRSHRLITRGAAVECLAPSVKGMGETDFFDLMEKVFSMPEVKALLPVTEEGDRT